MKWYYSNGDQPVGPMDRAELESLYTSGVITTGTLVFQMGMYDWVPYRDLKKTTQILPLRDPAPMKELEEKAEPKTVSNA